MTVSMKGIKLALLSAFAAAAVTIFISGETFVDVTSASPGGAVAGRTGAPGELTCTDCHNAATGVGQFLISAPANYVPGQTYQIQVRHTTTDTTRKRWGFQVTALASGAMAGSFASTTTNTQLKTGSTGRIYVGQTTAGTFQNQTGGAVWSFNWTAPATNVGAITFYGAGLQANNDGAETGDQTYVRTSVTNPPAVIASTHTVSDFDGDGRTDVAVLRNESNTSVWYAKTAAGLYIQRFGLPTDKFVPADYDGDGKTDPTVFRNGSWWSYRTGTNTVSLDQFGAAGDSQVIGDFDGDGLADLCIFRQGTWWVKRSSDGAISARQWGSATDKPVSGDFDGDGKADLAIYRANSSEWWITRSSNGTVISMQFGVPGDVPVPADYDGDHSTNIAVFRPSEGKWYTSTDVNNNYYGSFYWGTATDVLAPGDYDGDGRADAAVYRNGVWYIRNSANGLMSVQYFGIGSDTVVPNLYIQ